MKKILVTGGAGFLGSNLCRRLLKEGNHVICLDNLFTGNIENINDLYNNPNFKFLHSDVLEPIDLEVDEIYNAACPASPPFYQLHPTETVKTCVIGIINLLELSKKNNATLLQFSTSEVYGDPLIHPQVETYRGHVNPIGIRSCYDEGKRCAEALCFDYNREFNAKVKVVRIFNTYGPGMAADDGRVVTNFITQALKGEEITIYGNGKQTRSFCYVDDLIDGIIRMMESSLEFLGPVNLGNPGEFTMLELAELIKVKVGGNSNIVFKTLPQDDPLQRCPDISLAKNKLGWQPQVTLDKGLDDTIEYLKSMMKR